MKCLPKIINLLIDLPHAFLLTLVFAESQLIPDCHSNMNRQHEPTCLWGELKFLPLNAFRERSMTCSSQEYCLSHMA